MKLSNILSIIKVQCENFKFFRMGRLCAKIRPLKIVFPDTNFVFSCLINNKYLSELNICISTDLTPAQYSEI